MYFSSLSPLKNFISLSLIATVPNLFGTRDRFCGRQFFHGLEWGAGEDRRGSSGSNGTVFMDNEEGG